MSLRSEPTTGSVDYTKVEGREESLWWRHRYTLLLALVLLAAAFFRFFGTNFDQNRHQHPDERFITGRTIALQWPSDLNQLLDARNSPMNLRGAQFPDGYAYGSLPVYLTRATGWLLDSVLQPTDTRPRGYFLGYDGTTLLGRSLASIFDLITVLLVFLIGRRLYSRSAGLIAAALVAFAVTQIQLAHYYASDTFLTTFMTGAIYFAVVLMQRPAWWAAMGLGMLVGLAIASKVTIVPFALIAVAAVGLRTLYRAHTRKLGAELGDPVGVKPASAQERSRSAISHFLNGSRYLVIAGFFAVLAFAVTEPYVLWSFDFSLWPTGGLDAVMKSNRWWTRLLEESETQSGRSDGAPYTRQYVGTVPLLYHLQQLVFWGLSPIPGVVVVAGFVAGLWRALRARPAEVLLLTGAIPYFATILTLEAKWMRYMLPLVPIFCLLGAAMLVRGVAWERTRRAKPADRRPAQPLLVRASQNVFAILTGVTISAAFLWAVAFANIYTQDQSREQASQWIYDNIPRGSTLSGEAWDDALPLAGPESYGKVVPSGGSYFGPGVTFDLYPDRPPQETLNYIREQMAQTDYIILASNRLYGSMARLPWRYAVQTRFYELLFAEKLGFVRAYTSQVTPEIFGIKIDDQSADESFTVYDHPRVDIFRKVSTLTNDQLATLFNSAVNRPPGEYSTARRGSVSDDKSLALDQPLAALPDVGDYSWNPLAQEDTQWIGVILWLIVVYVLGILALPVLFIAARNLPDRAYPLSKVVGLLLVSWATWMLANGRVLPFTVWTVALMVLALAAVSALCWRLGAGAQIREFMREKRSLVIFYEAGFLVAFIAFLGIRLLNPDLWQPWLGGEKPMEMGFLNATLRSPWMPPPDPFFSGGYINYYYYGYFVVGCIIKLVGMAPSIAFNVAIPTLYGMAVSGATSIGYNIVAASRRDRGSRSPVSRVGMAFGVLSAVLMLVIGNLHALYQVVQMAAPQVTAAIMRGLATMGVSVPSLNGNFSQFNFWDPRSIIPNTINEFPFWTFLFADLHPHLIDIPFTITAIVLSLNLAFTVWRRVHGSEEVSASPSAARPFVDARNGMADLWGEGWTGFAAFALFALVLGALAVTNSWDFPTYAGVAGLGVLIALLRLWRLRSDEGAEADADALPQEANRRPKRQVAWPVYVTGAASVAVLVAVALLGYLPFFLSFEAFYTAIIPIVDGGLIPGTQQPMNRTALPDFILFWSFFIFIAASYLIYRLWRFPWQEAMIGWLGPRRTRSTAPAQGASSKPAFGTGSLLFARQRPALAAASTGAVSTVAFSSGRQSPPESSANRQVANDTSPHAAPVENEPDHVNASQVATADRDGSSDVATDAAGPPGEAGNGISYRPAGPLSWSDLTSLREYEHEPDATLDARYYATPDVPNWVAVAHAHAAPVVARPAGRSYAGVLPPMLGLAMLLTTAAIVGLQIATGQYLLALLVALLGGIAATTLAETRSAPGLITGGLLCVALAVALGVELVYLADHLNGGSSFRMNTVFKFYMQVWVLFAAGSAPAIYYLLFGLRERKKVKNARLPEQMPVAVVEAPALPLAASFAELTSDNANMLVPRDSAQGQSQPPTNWLAWSEATVPALAEDKPTPPDYLLTHPAPGAETQEASSTAAPTVEDEARPRLRPRFTASRLAWLTALALFLAASLLYPVYGTRARVNDRFPVRPPIGSLNGMNFMTVGTFTTEAAPLPVNLKQDYQAINWMNRTITGLHTIAELPMGYYRDYGMRVASNTGFPMVVGGLHQSEQRAQVYDRLVSERATDMNEFFTTADIQRALIMISKYDIEFIYLGQLERASGPNGMPKFEQMADEKVGVLKEVFRSSPDAGTPGTVIYQVVKPAKSIVGAPVPNSGNVGISITPVPTATSTPLPTPPVNDPELNRLIAAVVAKPNDRETRLNLVRWYSDKGYFSEAARELETVVAQEPANIAARHMLGDAYQQGGRPDKALSAWEQARAVDPNNPAVHNKLGVAYLDRQRYDDAILAFQAAVNVDQRFVESWFQLGTAYEAKGDTAKAREAYQNAIDKSTEPNTWSEQARARIAKLR